MSSILKEHIKGKREFEKELGNALEVKLKKIKTITSNYKREFGSDFEIQKTNSDKGVERKLIKTPLNYYRMSGSLNSCSFFFNEGQVWCGTNGNIHIDPVKNDVLICSFSTYETTPKSEKHGSRICVNKNLNLANRCVDVEKADFDWIPANVKVIRQCSPNSSFAKQEFSKFSKKSFSWLEEANRIVDKFLPYVKQINNEVESKRRSLKSSLSEWEAL